MGNKPEYVGTSEASKLLQVTGRRVVGLCSEGRLPGAFKTGRNWKIPMKSVIQYMTDTGINIPEKSADAGKLLLPFAIGNTSYIEIL